MLVVVPVLDFLLHVAMTVARDVPDSSRLHLALWSFGSAIHLKVARIGNVGYILAEPTVLLTKPTTAKIVLLWYIHVGAFPSPSPGMLWSNTLHFYIDRRCGP